MATQPRWPLLALFFGLSLPSHAAAQPAAPFPEAAATITHLAMQYAHASEPGWASVYTGLVQAMPDDVRFTVAVESGEERERLDALLQVLEVRRPEVFEVDVPITPWTRDRALYLGGRAPVSVLTPFPDGITDDYAGDLAAAAALAERMNRVHASASVSFEGGDIVCMTRLALLGHGSIAQNSDARGPLAARRRFEQLLQRKVAVLGRAGAPHEHIDMFLTPLGPKLVALGCPELGAALLREGYATLPTFDEWTEEAQRSAQPRYAGILRELEALGLEVVRVPILHGAEDSVLTWNNCLVERRDGVVHVYMPTYRAPGFDEAAGRVFEGAGCRVHPIDASAIVGDGGAVRCLTNVVQWRPDLGRRRS